MSNIDEPTTPPNQPAPPPPPAYNPPPTGPPAYAPQQAYAPVANGQPGQIRGTGISILLFIVTLGIYGWVYYYKTHEEMKRHSGQGLGGAIALILAIFVSIVMPFLFSSEVGGLYKRVGREAPVSGVTGLWILLPLVGAIIWFVKSNGALNDYWQSQGVQA